MNDLHIHIAMSESLKHDKPERNRLKTQFFANVFDSVKTVKMFTCLKVILYIF